MQVHAPCLVCRRGERLRTHLLEAVQSAAVRTGLRLAKADIVSVILAWLWHCLQVALLPHTASHCQSYMDMGQPPAIGLWNGRTGFRSTRN